MADTEADDNVRQPAAPQCQYAYYMRCERIKAGGDQCKAPALKGTRVCYKHTQQDQAKRRREEMIRALELPPLKDVRSIRAALSKIAQALIDDRIDEGCARYLFHQVQTAMFQPGKNSRSGPGEKIMSSWNELNV